MSKPNDLVQGTLDLLLLKILAIPPLHGWAIRFRLRSLARLGRRQLETEAANWLRLSSAISQVIQLSEA